MSDDPLIRYGVILADPPWAYRQQGRPVPYECMTVEKICALPVSRRAADAAVLFLWATWPCLQEAFEVIRAWDFTYKTGMPWIKCSGTPYVDLWGDANMVPNYGMGFWVRGCSEPLLIAQRGDTRCPDDPPIGLISDLFEHSRKPDNVYDYAALFPGPYLELFARRSRDGWDAFGKEIEGSIIL